MIDKFIKINTATSGPVLVNAADIASVIHKGSYTQINVGQNHHYTVDNIPALSGNHTALEVTSGTTTSDGTGGWPPQLIDSNATFTSSGILPGDRIFDNPVTQILDNLNPYEQISNIIVNDTTLNVNSQGLASGVDYKIYSGSKIYDPSADFVAAGVQAGWAVILGRGQAGATPISNIFVSAVTTNTITLIGENNNNIANYGADSVLADRALGLDGANEPVTYKIFNPEQGIMQNAINSAIVDVLNNTATTSVVEVPFVTDGFKTKNFITITTVLTFKNRL